MVGNHPTGEAMPLAEETSKGLDLPPRAVGLVTRPPCQ